MRLIQLSLKAFRNYDQQVIEFSPGINVFIGENAQGKTNLLEAIHTLALTKSHRTSHDRELIEFQAKEAYVKGYVETKNDRLPLSLYLGSKGKIACVNHLQQARLSQYIGHLTVILFAPEDLSLVKGSPNLRRNFLDREIGQLNPLYLHHSVQYKQLLKQRNAYLKALHRGQQRDRIYLQVLSDQLSESGAYLIAERQKFIGRLEELANRLHGLLSGNREELSLSYVPSLSMKDKTEDLCQLRECLIQTMASGEEKDIERETTTVGPHRDDFSTCINGKNCQLYGSQGQQRSAVLSLKLAEIELAKALTGDYPLLLLDDVLSELDDRRQTFLLKTIQDKVQTFLTTTSLAGINQKLIQRPTIYRIEEGKIKDGVCQIDE